MAMTKCKECKRDVSNNAKKCPHCGVGNPGTTAGDVFGGLVGLIFIVLAGWWIFGDDDETAKPEKTPVQLAAEAAACRKNLQCWGDKHSISAGISCEPYVTKLAKFSHEWTDGMLEPKFGRFRWKDSSAGTVTYIGDKIRFQNGFGAWQNHVYECDYDPQTEVVSDVRARPGSL